MGEEESQQVAINCFNNYTKGILLQLKPRRIILVGKLPYELLNGLGYIEREIGDCEFCSLQIENLKMPVLRLPYPRIGSCEDDVYDDFICYCTDFDYEV